MSVEIHDICGSLDPASRLYPNISYVQDDKLEKQHTDEAEATTSGNGPLVKAHSETPVGTLLLGKVIMPG